MEPDPRTLQQLVDRIVEAVRPLRIVVFGSAAAGEMRPGGDIDLLVVMPEGTHRRRVAQELYRRVRGTGVPFDVIVATPGDLETHKDSPGLIYRSILAEGKEIYVS
jgi:predicted nucleotidyltransferase